MSKFFKTLLMRKSVESRLREQLDKAQHDRLDHMASVEDHALLMRNQMDALQTCNIRIARLKDELETLTQEQNKEPS